jgi:hypothetical protein
VSIADRNINSNKTLVPICNMSIIYTLKYQNLPFMRICCNKVGIVLVLHIANFPKWVVIFKHLKRFCYHFTILMDCHMLFNNKNILIIRRNSLNLNNWNNFHEHCLIDWRIQYSNLKLSVHIFHIIRII